MQMSMGGWKMREFYSHVLMIDRRRRKNSPIRRTRKNEKGNLCPWAFANLRDQQNPLVNLRGFCHFE